MKKALYIATVVKTHINVFHIPFLEMLKKEGYETYVAAGNDTNQEIVKIPGCDKYIDIDFKRNPFHPGNIRAFIKLRELINENEFDIIHCHTPVGGVLGRLAAYKARKNGTKVYYTVHGFHFYKGAPLKNWLLYYPVEKICSKMTDVLITINKEDYTFALKNMYAKDIVCVPGVGIDVNKFKNVLIDKAFKRRSLCIPTDATLILSVGELNKNKNHEIIIKTLAKLKCKDLYYIVAGAGPLYDYLVELSINLGVDRNVKILGYRDDIPELYEIADLFCFPSKREGLPVSVMEAMANGLPCIVSDIRGNRDLVKNGENGILVKYNSVEEYSVAITALLKKKELLSNMCKNNILEIEKYSVNNIVEKIRNLYLGK